MSVRSGGRGVGHVSRIAMAASGGTPTPPPAPALVTATYNDIPRAMMGFASQPSGGRWNMTGSTENVDGAMFALSIKGSDANMYGFGGDSTPYRVLVDSETFTGYVTPTLAAGKLPLFAGLSDAAHTVFIWADNSPTGQGFVAPSGTLFDAFGSAATIQPMSAETYYLAQPDFPGVATGLRITNAYYPTSTNQMIGRAAQTGYGTVNASIHMQAKYDSLWVYCNKAATHANISINGALASIVSLSALDAGAQTTGGWRKINTPAQANYVDIIIAGVGADTGSPPNGHPMMGIMAVGANADILAPTNTAKRHVTMMGASQVEGVNSGTGGFKNDLAMVQNRLDIFGVSCGLAGSTITTLTTAIPGLASKIAVKDIALLSVGINSTDDGAFQTAYTALIQACLDNGWTKVVARGLATTASNVSKNAKIAAAVASFSSANVVYADVSTWGVTTNGAGGTISMPDGAHPDAAGYALMADFWVRDHASLFA